MTIKQTHTSADGQERTCAAYPGNCPLTPDNPLNQTQHSLYIDGEKLTPQQQTELYQLYENYHQLLTLTSPNTKPANYLKHLTEFTNKYIQTAPDGQWPTLTPFIQHYLPEPNPNPMEVIQSTLFPIRLSLNHTPEQTQQYRLQYEQYILAGVPEILAAQLTLSDPQFANNKQNPASTPNLTNPALIPAFIQHVYLNSSNPEIIKYSQKNPHPLPEYNPHIINANPRDYMEHKHWVDGPLYENETGNGYYMYGLPHRPHQQGPAYERYATPGNMKHQEEYRENGERHRPWTQGPAYTAYLDVFSTSMINEETPTEQAYYWRGELHRPWQDGPAYQTPSKTVYYYHGKLHRPREEGPAIEGVNIINGNPMKEYWEYGVKVAED